MHTVIHKDCGQFFLPAWSVRGMKTLLDKPICRVAESQRAV
jgi:hypothetical protein